jgi:DNA-binding transcriptional MerR regulator
MEYDIAELARVAGLSVDTIRYYQTLGLLHGPERRGRNAVYDETHLKRLEQVRGMTARGFSLKAIAALLEAGGDNEADRLLFTAIEGQASEPRYSSQDLAKKIDVPRTLLAAIERTGLADTETGEDGSRRYSEADMDVARGAVKLLKYGFPISRLLRLAVQHDRAVRKTVDEAIDLFDAHVRKPSRNTAGDKEAVAEAFRDLLPVVTALVAHHFQRVLVNRALKRLKKSGEERELQVAKKVASRTRFGFRWR